MAETGRITAHIAVDADRTFCLGLPPIITMWQFWQGKLHLPAHKEAYAKDSHARLGLLGQGLTRISNELLYGWRSVTGDAKTHLPKIKDLMVERGYSLKTVILSGRDEGKRSITERKLRSAGCRGEFEPGENGVLLNDGSGSAISKERRVKKWLMKGETVVVFEDDLRTALSANRALYEAQDETAGKTGNLIIYVVNDPGVNPFYQEKYLRKNGIKLPPNIKIVRTFAAAYEDLNQTLPVY